MKEKDIIEIINGIQVNPSVKARIMDYKNNKFNKKSYIKRPIAIVVTLLLVCFISVGFSYIIGDKDINNIFGGFVITACDEKGGEVTLTPNVEILLGKYSPVMSSVPGLPFHIELKNEDESNISADEIKVSVDKGIISTWDQKSGIVENKGELYFCKPGDTIYWAPLTDEGGKIKNCKLLIYAMKDTVEIGKVEIMIKETDDFYYFAEIVNELS